MATTRAPMDPALAAAISADLETALLSWEPRLERAIKWRRPTFRLNGDWHHWLCAMQASGGAVHLWFHKGGLLDDEAGVLPSGGTSRYLRRLTDRAPEEVDASIIASLIADAVRHRREMLPPDELQGRS
jgi:hypothetical protein